MNHDNQHIPHILLVDDTPQNLQLLAEMLAHHLPCDLSFATDGYQALEAVKTDRPDLVLLDVMMPGMSGFEVCNRLKHSPDTVSIPIIFLTAKTETADMATGFNLGASDYVTKPFNAIELLARIKTHLHIRQSTLLITRKNDELRQMLHILCHDLANPVGTILSLLEMIDPENPDTESLEMVEQMAENAMDLIGMVRQMRAIEDGKIRFTLQSVPLREACLTARNIISPRLMDKDIALNIQIPADVKVLADQTALVHSVLCNVLTNAVKFSEPHSTVTISARTESDGTVQCVITDQGIGIPKSLLNTLFEANAQTSRPGTGGEVGTGFGMPLIKHVMESFGASIRVESRDRESFPDHHGTTITLILQQAV